MPYLQPRVKGYDSTSNVTGSTKAPISPQSNVNAVAVMMRGQPSYFHGPKQACCSPAIRPLPYSDPRVRVCDNMPNEMGGGGGGGCHGSNTLLEKCEYSCIMVLDW